MNQTRVLRKVRIDRILPAHFQARQMFPPEAINQLAASMKEVGQNSPLLVRPAKPANDAAPSDECFELVCGECRLRAAKRLGWTTLWAVVEEMTDEEAALRGMVDNEQRRSLNPIERASGYQRLINEYGLSQQQVAQRGGIAGSTLSRLLVLLDEPSEIQEMLQRGALTEYHCRALDRVVGSKETGEDRQGSRPAGDEREGNGRPRREAHRTTRAKASGKEAGIPCRPGGRLRRVPVLVGGEKRGHADADVPGP